MNTYESLQQEAVARLKLAAIALRARLDAGDIHVRTWEPHLSVERTKVGRGWLIIAPEDPLSYPGISYTSSQGPSSDNSYGGFLPGVTYEEAKLLVYGDYKKHTSTPPNNI